MFHTLLDKLGVDEVPQGFEDGQAWASRSAPDSEGSQGRGAWAFVA